MEVCEDMSVDLEVVNMRKRQYMDGVIDQPNNKRKCHGQESFTDGTGALLNQLDKCDMVYWQMEISADTREPMNGFMSNGETRQDCMPPQNHPNIVPPQLCQRCIAGESGHINHILQL